MDNTYYEVTKILISVLVKIKITLYYTALQM